jgi:hypothetical protein
MTEDNNNKKSYKKKDKYEKEQQEIVRKLNGILGLDEKNNKFVLEELKQDEEKQKQIIGLEEEVKKYFVYNRWPYFNKNKEIENKWMSLLKSIYKSGGYNMVFKNITILLNEKKIATKEYYIIKYV